MEKDKNYQCGSSWEQVEWIKTKPGYAYFYTYLLCRFFEILNNQCGRIAAWLMLFMGLTSFAVVVARYGLNIGSIKMQESVIYMHAAIFMLCGAYCLQRGSHVRIDVLYAKLSPQHKTWIDILGTLVFLLPSAAFLFYISIEYVSFSWIHSQGSIDPQGLPYIYILKTLLLIMPAMLVMQGLSDLYRYVCFLLEWIEYKQDNQDMQDLGDRSISLTDR